MANKSQLVLHDIDTGAEEVVFTSENHFEAPNWSPCGTYLVINGGGRVYRLALGSGDLIEIETGTLRALNNDHGISPDGNWLAVSESPGRGTSCIYMLPIGGGTPRRVTPNVPSYWHGWSPDGATLTYTAKRGDSFNIFTIPVAGGEETQITFGAGHKDGPDYTPDGRWIWYNSDHGGSMDLWRVRPDGSAQEQMTFDAAVNWFAHPSPDNQHIVYLAYAPGTEGHPGDKEVTLNLMPSQGGPARVLTRLFGGQGTINVPSWSPDSRCFAYMRYARP